MIDQNKRNGIFKNILVMLMGCYPAPGPPKSALENLVTVGDGVILRNKEELWNMIRMNERKRVLGSRIIIVCNNEADIAGIRSHILETISSIHIDIAFVLPLWIMDSVSNVGVQNVKDSKYSVPSVAGVTV